MTIIDGREYTDVLGLVRPQSTEAVMIKDINANSGLLDSAFSLGRIFGTINPGTGAVGSALTAERNMDTMVRDEDQGLTGYGDSFKIGCAKGISVTFDPTDKEVSIAHTNSITSGNLGGIHAIPIIKWDAEGHLTNVGSATVYPPSTAGTDGQVWMAVARPANQAQTGAWATLTTDNILSISIPSGADGEQATSNIVVSHTTAASRPASVKRTTIGSTSIALTITYDEYGHILSTSGSQMYPPLDKGTKGQVWLSVGTDSGHGAWTGQKSLDVGKADLARTALKLVDDSSNAYTVGSGIKPVYFVDGIPKEADRSIPVFSTSKTISSTVGDNATVSFNLTGKYTMAVDNVTGDDLINAKWAIARLNQKQDNIQSQDISLVADKWTQVSSNGASYYTQEVSLTGISATATVWAEPDEESCQLWYDHEVRVVAQDLNKLTFRSTTKPAKAVTVEVAWAPKGS